MKLAAGPDRKISIMQSCGSLVFCMSHQKPRSTSAEAEVEQEVEIEQGISELICTL